MDDNTLSANDLSVATEPSDAAPTPWTDAEPHIAITSSAEEDRPICDPCDAADAGAQAAPGMPLRVMEALLFAADAPISAARLVELVGSGNVTLARLALHELNDQYTSWGVAFRVVEIANGYQLMTLPEYRPWLNKLNRQRAETRLSDATLETVAIIAYKQPIIRADIEAIRGVACGEVIHRLREMGLVRICGRAEVVGRPMLYATTKRFLDIFGLSSLDDLPPMETLKLRQPPAAPAITPSAAADAIAVAGS
ncbi:MAG: SMC-Scp complex subunit ScpB [Planctomycetes bacterium]|nr:SMC-Scp complex subunit ScpB [Planctomycetota bacterium]